MIQGEFKGPESLAYKDKQIYAGVIGGDIIKFDTYEGTVTKVAKIGPPNCGTKSLIF